MTDTALIERLEKAEGPDRELDYMVHRATHELYGAYGPHPRYTASLDAAMMLVPADALWSVCDMEEGPFAQVIPPASGGTFGGTKISGYGAPTPAIALCIAALRARAAKGE